MQLFIDERPDGFISSMAQSVSRFWRRDSRYQTLQKMYAIFDATIELIEQTFLAIERAPKPSSRKDQINSFRNQQLILNLTKALEEARAGIKVLHENYADINFQCQLLLLDDYLALRLREIAISNEYLEKRKAAGEWQDPLNDNHALLDNDSYSNQLE